MRRGGIGDIAAGASAKAARWRWPTRWDCAKGWWADRLRRLALPHALWSRQAVQQAVRMKFALDMPIRTVGEYLRRWGFTPQRPARRALEQRPEQVRHWLQEDYPALVRGPSAEGAQISWADETALRQDTAWVRGYAPAGRTPVLESPRDAPSLTLISALTNQGLLRFACHDGAIDAGRFIDISLQAHSRTLPPRCC